MVCQKSKVNDWVDHFREHYSQWTVFDATSRKMKDTTAYEYGFWMNYRNGNKVVPSIIVINYDLIWRRAELMQLKDFWWIFILAVFFSTEIPGRLYKKYKNNPVVYVLLAGVLGVAVYCLLMGLDDPFMYFRF